MCFYDQITFLCGDFKWGHFREHCSKEYRTGETCGVKMVMATCSKAEVCKLCTKIDIKRGRITKEEEKIARWSREHKTRVASIESAREIIQQLHSEIATLEEQRDTQRSANTLSPLGRRSSNSSLESSTASSSASSWESSSTISIESSSTIPIDDRSINDEEHNEIRPRTGFSVNSIKAQDIKRLRRLRTNEPLHEVETNFPTGSARRLRRHEIDDEMEDVTLVVNSLDMARMVQLNHQLSCPSQTRNPWSRDKTWEKSVEITWQCLCGTVFHETVVEYSPGAAKALAESTEGCQNIDIERLAGPEYTSLATISSSSSASLKADGSLRPCNKKVGSGNEAESLEGRAGEDCSPTEKEYILFCKAAQKEIVLKHANVTKAPCDYSSYHVLHRKHFGKYYPWYKWIYLFDISSVEFVKFHLFWGKNVSISEEDFGKIPSASTPEYRYMSATNPPVLKTALQHFIQYPGHAPKKPCHRPRIPKKLNGKLSLKKEVDSQEGYGLYLQESICWSRVFVIEGIFATCCLLFAVVWSILHNGGIQDGFAIAGTGIAYLTIILGALQAVSRRN